MTAENREHCENDCVQALEKYLRQEASYDALTNDSVHAAFKDRLAFMAKDWHTKRGMRADTAACCSMADEALDRYMSNWKGKVQGEDDRGKRLGKVVNTTTGAV